MAPSLITYNSVGAQCILTSSDSCLYQVAGYTDNNPEAQLSACQSLFGFPTVPTVTLSADRVFSTDIATAIYTDIITATDTLHITTTETLTETVTISETDTQYTATLVKTVSATDIATVTTRAPVTTTLAPAKLRRRGGCRARTSSSLLASSAAPLSSVSSSVVSALPSSSTASTLPLASACPNEAAYSSACGCLVLPAVTQSSDPIASVVRQTETTTVTSTSYTTAIEVTTQTVPADDVVTTTATATEYTNTETTTTATTTTTTTVRPPIPTDFSLKSNEDPARNFYMSGNGRWYSALLSPLPGLTSPVKLASPNTQPGNRWSPEWALYALQSTSGTYELGMTTAQIAPTLNGIPHVVTCTVDEDTMTLKCKTGSLSNLEKIIACGDKIYMLKAGVSPPAGCAFIEFSVVGL